MVADKQRRTPQTETNLPGTSINNPKLQQDKLVDQVWMRTNHPGPEGTNPLKGNTNQDNMYS